MNRHFKTILCVTTACAAASFWTTPASAQQPTQAQARVSEVIVTARKRQESILNVPVIETAVPQEQLERLQVSDVEDLQKLVPGLNLGHALLSIGSLVSIRGVGTASQDPGVDQSVALNLDGMALGQGLAFTSGMFDVGQVEVLKGPQALFYGKSSPGGVISLRTADPTDRYEVIARAGYEIEAREARGELIVSGPVSDTLKARLAAMYSRGEGYFRNEAVAAPGTGALNPTHRREPQPRNFMIRGTLLWTPISQFDARLKVNYVRDKAIDAETAQLSSCPNGPGFAPAVIPFIGGDDCKMDRNLRVVYLNPANFAGVPRNGVPFLENIQTYGTLELNYRFRPELVLTSTTGIYQLSSRSSINTSHTTAAGPTLNFQNRFQRRDLTQELRLNSDFPTPVNFTLGAFYQDGRLSDRVTSRGNSAYFPPAVLPLFATDGETDVDIKTYSVFGQLRWQILPNLELAGGARWTDEKRSETVVSYVTGMARTVNVLVPRIHSKNTAPEVTLTYRPTEDLTLFAAYKRAYKSGSFSIATIAPPGGNNAFGDEKVKGGEVGLKSRLLDRRLSLNLAAYNYRYNGLQVGAVEPATSTGQIIIRTVNAGSARTRGVDFDAAYRPPQIEGLGLNASVNWNKGRYKNLTNVPCYGGQTIAEGCNQSLNPVTGRFTAQDLSGTPLIRAPKWQATFGFDYEWSVGNGRTMVFTNSNQYSSRFVTYLARNRPNDDNYQQGYIKTDVSLALRGPDERWEIALIGKNITDRITAGNCSAAFFSSGLVFASQGQITGGPTRGSAGVSETGCYSEQGREFWFRFTYRPFSGR